MAWVCPDCGIQNDDDVKKCAGCSYVKFGILQLVSAATGKRIRVQVDTTLGRSILKSLGDEDVKYSSEPQFTLTKDVSLGSWAVTADAVAKNPTFLNGTQLNPVPAALVSGAVLTIGPEKLKLKVELDT
jgi:hypothetical protein